MVQKSDADTGLFGSGRAVTVRRSAGVADRIAGDTEAHEARSTSYQNCYFATTPQGVLLKSGASTDDEIAEAEQELIEAAGRLADLKQRRAAERQWRPRDNLTAEEIADIESE